MSIETLNNLRSQIKTLTEAELLELTRELVMHLEGFDKQSVEQSWADEIENRIKKIESGEAKLLSRIEFETKMQAELNSYQ